MLVFRLLSVISLEPCEFLKISTSDYARVIQVLFGSDAIQSSYFIQNLHYVLIPLLSFQCNMTILYYNPPSKP